MLLLFVPSLPLQEDDINEIISFSKVVNIISITIAITNYVLFNFLHRDLIFVSGSYKYINGIIIHRAGGLCTTSGTLAEICLFLLLIALFSEKTGVKSYFEAMLYFIGILCTRGRVPCFMAYFFIGMYIWFKVPSRYRKKWRYAVFVMATAVGILTLQYTISFVMNTFAMDFKYQIRWKAYSLINNMFSGNILECIKKF